VQQMPGRDAYLDGLLGQPVSHGCVRLAPANAATLFALVQTQGLSQTKVVVFGQTPARGGEEIARRRAPAGRAAAQPMQVAPPGYDGYQAARPQPYPAQAYGQQQPYLQQSPPYAPPPPQGYYRQAPQPYSSQQAQQQPGYYQPQPQPVYILRQPGLYTEFAPAIPLAQVEPRHGKAAPSQAARPLGPLRDEVVPRDD
jgi:hypothetical protein